MTQTRRTSADVDDSSDSNSVLGTELPDQTTALVRRAELPVSEHAIRVWCAAVGDTNPIYHDASQARRAGLPGVVAPNAMLQTWTVPISAAERRRSPTLHSQVRARASQAGFKNVVATNYAQDYFRPVRPGDLLTELSWVESVSPVKRTALGYGCFVNIVIEVRDESGEAVGRLRSCTFYFDPNETEGSHTPRVPDDQTPGTEWLAPLKVPLDRALIIAGALASNDHEPVHFDHELARSQGLDDIIASIVTTSGLVLRYLGERMPADTWCNSLHLHLARPAFPGDILTLQGRRQPTNDGELLHVTGEHPRGRHVTARLRLESPPSNRCCDDQ